MKQTKSIIETTVGRSIRNSLAPAFGRGARRFAAAFLGGLVGIAPVWADDTEIFFGDTSAGGVAPNMLLIVDTSGSMNNLVSGTGKDRLENVQDALRRADIDAGVRRSGYHELAIADDGDETAAIASEVFGVGRVERIRAIDAVTLEDCRRVVATWFPRENLVFTAIGVAEEVSALMEDYGDLTQRENNDPGFGSMDSTP